MHTIAIPPKARRVWSGAAAVAYSVAVFVLTASAVALWRMCCEGFGCVGKGIAWFAWAISFLVTLVVGYVARRTYHGAGHTGMRYLLEAQAVAGVALVVYWVAWRAA
jgi:hypothetical protein